jgi:hypothetical protein
MQRTKWTERTFTFDMPEGWLPNILERLRGTPARINELTVLLSDEDASHTPRGKWSIKEHVGHLSDLEELHEGRIDDFLARKDTLRAADMNNTKTIEAEHNEKSIQQLFLNFVHKRKKFIARLEHLNDDTQRFSSMHPRLKVPMRPIDMAFFTAEHDDHHLADIREIIESMKD